MTSQVPDPVPSHFNPLHREGGDSDRRKKKRIRPLFQSTPPRGWRHNTGIWYDFYDGHFNPLHREGGDTAPPARQGQIREISIHSTARVETVCASNLFSDIPISIHSTARVETRIGYNYPIQRGISIHSTARVETVCASNLFSDIPISIHSTARVETRIGYNYPIQRGISIHSTARVETFLNHCFFLSSLLFQSTPPRGWRPLTPAGSLFVRSISIHSTARVETQRKCSGYGTDHISIHSTARVETAEMATNSHSTQYFNPLHREGGDLDIANRHIEFIISIHSTARVETSHNTGKGNLHSISIHSTARVETNYIPYRPSSRNIFQSTPPRGWRRAFVILFLAMLSYFNPLHREGGDIQRNKLMFAPSDFNPLHREGGDQR